MTDDSDSDSDPANFHEFRRTRGEKVRATSPGKREALNPTRKPERPTTPPTTGQTVSGRESRRTTRPTRRLEQHKLSYKEALTPESSPRDSQDETPVDFRPDVATSDDESFLGPERRAAKARRREDKAIGRVVTKWPKVIAPKEQTTQTQNPKVNPEAAKTAKPAERPAPKEKIIAQAKLAAPKIPAPIIPMPRMKGKGGK